ncbi:MAG: hypothetical protein Q9159_002526 [Coniocarpon cinnabarinum]
MEKIRYKDPTGRERLWEGANRTTKPTGADVDAVGIVAILEDKSAVSSSPHVLLQKQFRPPVNKVCIEVPAGLVDAGEGPEQSAVRELKEETGYVGEVVKEGWGVGHVMWNDPGMCSTTVKMIYISVDLSHPENRKPKQQLEDGEFIETFTVPMTDLHAECRKLEREGYAIDARVGGLAEGIEVAKRLKL